MIAAGIEDPIDLLRLDPVAFIAKQLKIADHKPILNKIVQRTLKKTINETPNPHVDVTKRFWSILDRSHFFDDVRTLTGFKRMFPKAFERLKPLTVLNIAGELNWVGEMTVNMKTGKMSPLSHATRKRTPTRSNRE